MLQVSFTILAQHWDNIEMLPGSRDTNYGTGSGAGAVVFTVYSAGIGICFQQQLKGVDQYLWAEADK